MSDTAISVKGLSKRYMISHDFAQAERYTALRDVLARNVRTVARKTRDVISGRPTVQGDSIEEFWALRDVSFEVKRGDILGIVGRNGAGKSTLLKILSRITEPSEGRVAINGRVASLLEVGTGFHPELTGRENIFLNGAILGMTRAEINRKFDEIVAFAEVEKFLDTPVKRYSSGMYVRLAFAVAAHLETEILVIDEVLAVGDARFQRKCLSRMDSIGRQGRTIIFVSHNMAMVSSLCNVAVHLENGKLRSCGPADKVILAYSSTEGGSSSAVDYRGSDRKVGDQYAQLLSADIRDARGVPVFEIEIDQPLSVRMEYRIKQSSNRVFIPNFHFYRHDGICAFVTNAANSQERPPGDYAAECHVPANFLNDGLYSVQLALTSFESGVSVHFNEKGAVVFNVRDPIEGVVTRAGYSGAMPGAIRPLLHWTLEPAGRIT